MKEQDFLVICRKVFNIFENMFNFEVGIMSQIASEKVSLKKLFSDDFLKTR